MAHVPIPHEDESLVAYLFGDRIALAETYADLLVTEGIEWGLIGPRETDRVWDRHIVNSLCVSPLINKGLFVADLGSGAGLPGIVLAIARPDLYIDLVEPMARRCDFLSLCVDRLGLGSTVNVVRCRVEEYEPSPDILTCRALANMSSLVEMVDRFIPPATLLAIKGTRAAAEVSDAHAVLSSHHLQADIIHSHISVPYSDKPVELGTVVSVHARRKK